MFNWVVKVVPRPPDVPGSLAEEPANPAHAAPPPQKKVSKDEVKKEVKDKPDKKKEDNISEDISIQSQSGVMTWFSNGFSIALPQPGTPSLNRSPSISKSLQEDERNGVIKWIAEGLSKVVPQPDGKYIENVGGDDEEATEIYQMKDLPDAEPLPHISVVELLSEDEEEVQLPHFPPNVVNWIKTAIPQPVMLPAGYVEAQTKAQQIQSKISSLEKVLSPPPDSLKSEEDSQTSNVVGWFVTGLGLKMPQPVTRSKDDVEVHSGGIVLRAP